MPPPAPPLTPANNPSGAGATQAFSVPQGGPLGAPPPRPVLPSGPSEYTTMFKAPGAQPQPGGMLAEAGKKQPPKPEKKKTSILPFVLLGVALVVIVILIVLFFVFRKKH